MNYKNIDEFIENENVAEMTARVVKECLSSSEINSAMIVSKDINYRLKATKILGKDKFFYGELKVTIGHPAWREKQRIANMIRRKEKVIGVCIPRKFKKYLKERPVKAIPEHWWGRTR